MADMDILVSSMSGQILEYLVENLLSLSTSELNDWLSNVLHVLRLRDDDWLKSKDVNQESRVYG